MPDDNDLPFGLYERLVTAGLKAQLLRFDPASTRVVTTVFTGSTERKALDWLVTRGAEVKVSYDTQSTRLHAKAWLFRRASGFSSAYIGSSNLSKAALVDGVEWNVRLSQVGSPDILEKFGATFDTYWESLNTNRMNRYETVLDSIAR
jgi:HKD family nuclease